MEGCPMGEVKGGTKVNTVKEREQEKGKREGKINKKIYSTRRERARERERGRGKEGEGWRRHTDTESPRDQDNIWLSHKDKRVVWCPPERLAQSPPKPRDTDSISWPSGTQMITFLSRGETYTQGAN